MEDILHIIQGCVNKEHKYQRIVYDRYKGYASKIVFRYIYRYEKAMDIVTDGFVKAFTHFDQFRYRDEPNPEALLMAWLKRIMINCSIDELRRNNMIPEIGGIPESVWDISSKTDNADQLILYKELVSLVKELPPQYRIVFNMYVLDGYTHAQIGDALNIPVSTSRANLSRARIYLQNMIKKWEEQKACRI